ncbi:cytochrome c and c1 heme-lyase [Xylariomycetidae sp. FL2044]|nr:cytochrome c and c1 heme-lyase [Xylariomycetidae sp. FL2044]
MSDPKEQDGSNACPVDHKSREAWLSQARSQSQSPAQQAQALPPTHPPVTGIGAGDDAAAAACPVDHKARDVWMQQARAAAATTTAAATPPPPPIPPSQAQSTQSTTSTSWTSYLPRIPFLSSSSSSSSSTTTPTPSSSSSTSTQPNLATDREISTIPRSSPIPPPPNGGVVVDQQQGQGQQRKRPANMEVETGADASSGNWIYPSEKMFFEAMSRKGHDPRAADMRTVVPIHNAVNERAWAEIKGWEGPWVKGTSCDGPRLHSFSGLSTRLTPRARVNTWLGYQAPFDRHDWVVDRCGKEIEYVIDFYAGRNNANANGSNGSNSGGKLSFYLDVRPKLNTWEGVKMRTLRAVGLV